MRETSVLIKPASSLCNCVCSYCFYDDVSNCRSVKSFGVIKEHTWKKLVDTVLESKQDFQQVNFVFQGGEPLVAGITFFRQFIDYVNQKKESRLISYSLQTNGTLLTKNFVKLFKENDFLIGISIDGFKENHNRNRFLRDGGSFDQVMEGMQLLRDYEIEFNVLTVLTKNLAKYPDKLFDFYLENNFNYVQIIPCLANFNEDPEKDLYACTATLYGSFYKTFFERWVQEFYRGNYMSEGMIDNILSIFLGGTPYRCGMLGQCQSQFVVEANGSVYPCDFYVMDQYECGNVNETSYDGITESMKTCSFQQDYQGLTSCCDSCRYINICHGNCKRLRSSFLNETACGYQQLLQAIEQELAQIKKVMLEQNKKAI